MQAMASAPQPSDRLGRAVLLAYGLPGLPLAALLLPLYVTLPAFYAVDLGLGFFTVGVVLLLARLWDVVTDPVIGSLSDRLTTRLGRRRPWLLAGAPLVMASAGFLFLPGPGAGWGGLLIWTMALYLGATMIMLPYTAWGAELSSDYDERSRIAGWREGLVVVGTLLAAGLPAVVGAERAVALEVIAWSLWIVLPLCLIIAVRFVPESPPAPQARLAWRQGLRVVWRNGPFRRLIAAYFLNGIANGLPATLFLLYVERVLEAPGWTGVLLFVYFLCGIAAIPLWLRLSRHWGKHRTWVGAMLWAALVFAFVPLLGPGDQLWFLAVCVLTGVSLGADLTLRGRSRHPAQPAKPCGTVFRALGRCHQARLGARGRHRLPAARAGGAGAGRGDRLAVRALCPGHALQPAAGGHQARGRRPGRRLSDHRGAPAAHPPPDRGPRGARRRGLTPGDRR
jgi:Na+/melibiose symporter-like transporter